MTDRTHWDGCWRDPGHHECAVARVERADLERDEALAAMSADTADVVLHFTSRATTAERALAELREAAQVGLMVLDLMWQDPEPGESRKVVETMRRDADRLRAALDAARRGDEKGA